MTTIQLDSDRMLQTLQHEAIATLGRGEGELVLDFSAVVKIDTGTARAMEGLADLADRSSIRIVLRAVNSGIYRALKLLKVAERFSFVS